MPARPIFLSSAARRNYRLARIAAMLVLVTSFAAFSTLVVLAAMHVLGL